MSPENVNVAPMMVVVVRNSGRAAAIYWLARVSLRQGASCHLRGAASYPSVPNGTPSVRLALPEIAIMGESRKLDPLGKGPLRSLFRWWRGLGGACCVVCATAHVVGFVLSGNHFCIGGCVVCLIC